MPRILTLFTSSGKVYQKIKLKDEYKQYKHILELIKFPELEKVKYGNKELDDSMVPILTSVNGKRIRPRYTINDLNVHIGFEIKRILKLTGNDIQETFIFCVPRETTDLHLVNYSNISPLPGDCLSRLSIINPQLSMTSIFAGCTPNVHTMVVTSHRPYKVENLSDSILQLELNGGYMESKEELPKNLHTFIVYGNNGFTLPKLPDSLKILWVYEPYNRPLPALPESLENLCYNANHDLPLLPESLQVLDLGDSHAKPLPEILPKNLKKLWYCGDHELPELPEGLTHLHLDGEHDRPLPDLPEGITKLTIEGYFDNPIEKLPSGLKSLTINTHGDTEGSLLTLPELPKGLIKLSYHQSKKLPKLPEGLKFLTVGLKYNHLLENLPEGLVELSISKRYAEIFAHKLKVPKGCNVVAGFGV